MPHPCTFHFYAVRYPHGHSYMLWSPTGPRAHIEPYVFKTIEARDAWVYDGGSIESPDDYRDFVTLADRSTLPEGWTMAAFKRRIEGLEYTSVSLPRKRKTRKPRKYIAILWHKGHGHAHIIEKPTGRRRMRASIIPYAFPTIQARFDWVSNGGGINSPDNYRQPIGSTTVPTGWTLAELRRQAEKRHQKSQAQLL